MGHNCHQCINTSDSSWRLGLVYCPTRIASSPPYLADLLKLRPPTRSLRSSDAPLLTVPRTQTALATRAFSVAAPTVWNGLPSNVRSCDSLSTFRRYLKTHVLPPRMRNVAIPVPLYLMLSWRSTNSIIVIFRPSVLNSRRYRILKTKQVRPQRRLLGGESAVEGNCFSPLKSHWHPLEQVSRFPRVFSDGCHLSAQLLH